MNSETIVDLILPWLPLHNLYDQRRLNRYFYHVVKPMFIGINDHVKIHERDKNVKYIISDQGIMCIYKLRKLLFSARHKNVKPANGSSGSYKHLYVDIDSDNIIKISKSGHYMLKSAKSMTHYYDLVDVIAEPKKILRMSWHNSKVVEQPKLMISMLQYHDWVLFKYDDRYEIWS